MTVSARCEARAKTRQGHAKLCETILLPIEEKPLRPQYKDRPVKGEWKHFRDCRIEPDWLPIYKAG